MKYILLICTVFLCLACEQDYSVDPTIMPKATTTGETTLGCLIDGWVYTSGRWGLPVAKVLQEEGTTYLRITAEVDFDTFLGFSIVNPKQGETTTYTKAGFNTQEFEDGKVTITRMSDGIVSGTFEGTRITKGRFDLRYKE